MAPSSPLRSVHQDYPVISKLFYIDAATSSAVLGNKTYVLLPIFIFGYGLQLTWFSKIVSGLLAFVKKNGNKPESKKI